MNKFDQRII